MSFKLVHLFGDLGEFGRVPPKAVLDIGGVEGNLFSVGGRPLLFADGTATDGLNTQHITLQKAYNNSSGTIDLSAGKDFVIRALDSKIFQVDAATGTVTITGDLTVLGSSTVIEGTIANIDQVSINPPNGTTTALLIEPMVGATMGVDLVRVRAANSGAPVFTIDASGNTSLKQLNVAGTINGIDLTQFYNDFQSHVDATLNKHTAEQISVDESTFVSISGANVQEALESVDDAIQIGLSAIRVFEHTEPSASLLWTVNHTQGSTCPTITIFDDLNEQVLPDEVTVIDANTLTVKFNSPQSGRAVVLLF